MKPKTIILVRHGESEGNVNQMAHAHTPDHKIQLTSIGIEQSIEAGEEIRHLINHGKFSKQVLTFVSPLVRTRDTWLNMKKGMGEGLNIREYEDPRLREQEWGHFITPSQFKSESLKALEYGPFYYRVQNGEFGADVYNRVSNLWTNLQLDLSFEWSPECRDVLLVTHGYTLRIIIMLLCRLTVEAFSKFANTCTGQVVTLRSFADKTKVTSQMQMTDKAEPEATIVK